MIIHNCNTENSILNRFVAELRDVNVQKDSMRFRRNIERVGEVLGYELSKTLNYVEKEIGTPLGVEKIMLPSEKVVLCAILRAGLPLHNGLLNYFDKAENAFISAYRDHKANEEEFDIVVNYLASPSIEDKVLVLIDPMLATGRTLETTFEALKKHGTPKQIHVVSVVGSEQGIQFIKNIFPENTHLWIAAVDSELNAKSYIVPGLGDAGDLSYGSKL